MPKPSKLDFGGEPDMPAVKPTGAGGMTASPLNLLAKTLTY